jgi:hypothetical protein
MRIFNKFLDIAILWTILSTAGGGSTLLAIDDSTQRIANHAAYRNQRHGEGSESFHNRWTA